MKDRVKQVSLTAPYPTTSKPTRRSTQEGQRRTGPEGPFHSPVGESCSASPPSRSSKLVPWPLGSSPRLRMPSTRPSWPVWGSLVSTKWSTSASGTTMLRWSAGSEERRREWPGTYSQPSTRSKGSVLSSCRSTFGGPPLRMHSKDGTVSLRRTRWRGWLQDWGIGWLGGGGDGGSAISTELVLPPHPTPGVVPIVDFLHYPHSLRRRADLGPRPMARLASASAVGTPALRSGV